MCQKKTEIFIKAAQQKHGNKYDYNNVEYITGQTKVDIKCLKHDKIFKQRPNDHLRGRGCSICGIETSIKNNTSTTEKFVKKASIIHKNKYDYSLVEYKNTHTKVDIKCSTHGLFQQIPMDHLKGSGCSKCSNEKKGIPTKKSLKQFIEEANLTHNNKYDYSLVDYESNKKKIKIICNDHGIFEQQPYNHIKGSGCPNCYKDKLEFKKINKINLNINKKKINTKTKEEFINEAKLIHKEKYDYSIIDYKNLSNKVRIICSNHGIFQQLPNDHLKGHGCSKCFHEKLSINQTKTKEDFVKESNLIHNNIYDYSLVEYVSNKKKVKIICGSHGIFEQIPNGHLLGNGCSKCGHENTANILRKSEKDFIEEVKIIHKNIYDYSETKYINAFTKIKIICVKHGEFEQIASDHLTGCGCPNCAQEIKTQKCTKTQEKFIEQANIIHKNKYDYSLSIYKNAYSKIEIICLIHGIFKKTPNCHLNGHGCPKCSKKIFSKGQIEWLNYIAKKDNIYIQHAMNEGEFKIPNTNFRVDGYCKETNTIFEYNGNYYHGNPLFFKPQEMNKLIKKTYGELYIKTLEKELLIREKGYNFIVIWEHEWLNLKKTLEI